MEVFRRTAFWELLPDEEKLNVSDLIKNIKYENVFKLCFIDRKILLILIPYKELQEKC